MAGFNGRRAPNVSQYIANLNTIQSPQEIANQQEENFRVEDDLAVFTNAEFLDFDLAEGIDQAPVNYDPYQEERARRENAAAHKNSHKVDFVNENYTFSNLPPFLADSANTSLDPSYQNVPAYANPTSPSIYDFPPSVATSSPNKNRPHHASPITNPGSPTSPSASHFAAEEDKRRRNTAASARFRVKKKQREQALERTAKELSDKAKELEKRVGQLETENEWLRGLVVERNGVVGLEKAMRDRDEVVEKKVEGENDKKKGVGTPAT